MLENLENGRNVAIVFDTPMGDALPETYTIDGKTFPVIDGRISDERFLDASPVIVGLSALAKGRDDESGFIVKVSH